LPIGGVLAARRCHHSQRCLAMISDVESLSSIQMYQQIWSMRSKWAMVP